MNKKKSAVVINRIKNLAAARFKTEIVLKISLLRRNAAIQIAAVVRRKDVKKMLLNIKNRLNHWIRVPLVLVNLLEEEQT